MDLIQLKYQTELKHKILSDIKISSIDTKLIDFRFDSTETKLILRLDMIPNNDYNLFKSNFEFTECIPDYKSINKFEASFHFNLI